MYWDLKKNLWWEGMRWDITHFIESCVSCRQVEAEHQRFVESLQPLPIPKWKWDNRAMNFVVGLPRTPSSKNVNWVMIDRFSKRAHFLPVTTIDVLGKLTQL